MHIALLPSNSQLGNDDASVWQKSVMALIHESLGTTTSSMPSTDSSGNIGVGLVLSKDRRDNIVVSRIIAGAGAVMSSELVRVGDRVMNVDGYIILNEFPLEHVCGRIMGKPGSTVQIKLYSDNNSTCKEIVFLRNPPSLGMPAAPAFGFSSMGACKKTATSVLGVYSATMAHIASSPCKARR